MNRPSDNESIEATAAAWLAQRDDVLTPEQEAEFSAWRRADPRHEAAVARLEAAWGALQQLRDFRPEAGRHPDRDLLRPAATIHRGPWAGAATAALAACAVFAAIWWWPAGPQQESASPARHYATTVDGYQRVALEDGSLLELNANSELTVQFTPAERRVRLERGEAHFTVAKNAARPFLVEAGRVAVQAIGTAFNVRLGAGDVEVLVTEGRVAVGEVGGKRREARGEGQVVGGEGRETRGGRREAGGEGRADGTALGDILAEIGVNERIVFPAVTEPAAAAPVSLPLIEKIPPEVVREALAWQGPRLVFVDTPLSEVVAQFNRRNQVQLELADAELGALPVGGSFRAENLEAFVRLLASDSDIAVSRPAPNRIVLRRASTQPGLE